MKFVDGSWCESNAALATVFLRSVRYIPNFLQLNTTMGGELRFFSWIPFLLIPLLIFIYKGS